MEKKELILTTAKDLMIAYRIMPEGKDRIKRENTIKALGDIFSKMADEVEKVYGRIAE